MAARNGGPVDLSPSTIYRWVAAGYDGIQLASVTNPAMTTYRQDTAALGKTAAAKLIELIEKPRTALVDRILIPGKLVEGGSVRAI